MSGAVGFDGGSSADEQLDRDVRCLLRALMWNATEGYDPAGAGADAVWELAGALLERYGVERVVGLLSVLVVRVVFAVAVESSCPADRVVKKLAGTWPQPRLRGWLRRVIAGGAGSPPAGFERDAVLALAGLHGWGVVWLAGDPARRPGVLAW